MVKCFQNKQQIDRNISGGKMVALGHKINEGPAVGRCTQETEGDPSTRYGREVYTESAGEWLFQTFQGPEQIVLQFGIFWLYDAVKAWLPLHQTSAIEAEPCHSARPASCEGSLGPSMRCSSQPGRQSQRQTQILLPPLSSQKVRQSQRIQV